ncbi:MAG: SRPBCC family protein [Cyclobacteriaceae bacterium]
MPKMILDRSIEIDAPKDKVFQVISDFNHWKPWSPWMIMEPEATMTIDEDSRYYSWEGKRVGTGNMKIRSEVENTSVDYDLNFLTPWKSYADVRFELEEKEGKTTATWFMESSLPWFLFWMKKMMTAFVGMDFQRGLNMLKEYVESGAVSSRLDFVGKSTYPGCKYIGIKTDCTIDSISEAMSGDIDKLMTVAGQNIDNVAGEIFSIYHKWDMVKRKVSYTSGVPVKEIPADLPEGLIAGVIPELSVYTLRHVGPYLHLGNAWTTLYSMERNKEIKCDKKHHPFETYMNNPAEVSPAELITEIHFPLK